MFKFSHVGMCAELQNRSLVNYLASIPVHTLVWLFSHGKKCRVAGTGYKCLKWEQREWAWAFFCITTLDLLFLYSHESQIHWVNYIVWASLTSVIILAGYAKWSKSTKSLLNHVLNSLSWIFPHEYSLCPCKCIAVSFACNHYLGFFTN